MGNLDLETLVVAGIAGTGLIELGMWVVVMIRYGGDDVLRLVPGESSSIQSRDRGPFPRSFSAPHDK
jgi:hypothetical protein